MKLPRAQAQDYAYSNADGFYQIERNEQVDSNRWSGIYELVIKDTTGKYWMACYQRGLTENQDEVPFEYDGEEIEFYEVERVPVTTYEYRKVT